MMIVSKDKKSWKAYRKDSNGPYVAHYRVKDIKSSLKIHRPTYSTKNLHPNDAMGYSMMEWYVLANVSPYKVTYLRTK